MQTQDRQRGQANPTTLSDLQAIDMPFAILSNEILDSENWEFPFLRNGFLSSEKPTLAACRHRLADDPRGLGYGSHGYVLPMGLVGWRPSWEYNQRPTGRNKGTITMSSYYIAHGSVRGSCGHKHRTIAAAQACCEKDQRDCQSLGGSGAYSDRSVTPVEERSLTVKTLQFRELTEAEQEELFRITDNK